MKVSEMIDFMRDFSTTPQTEIMFTSEEGFTTYDVCGCGRDSKRNLFVRLKRREPEIISKEEIPIIFSFGGKLVKLTRVTYRDADFGDYSVEYREEVVTSEYQNNHFPNGFN